MLKRTCCHDARFKHGYLALLAYHIIGYMGASAGKAEFCPLIRLSRHNKAWEIHTQGAKESLVAMHSSNIGTH